MNVFDKPKDPRELAHLGLARTFVQVRAEAKLAWIMPSAAETLKEKRTFKNTFYHKIGCTSAIKKQILRLFFCIAFALHYL